MSTTTIDKQSLTRVGQGLLDSLNAWLDVTNRLDPANSEDVRRAYRKATDILRRQGIS